MQFLKLYNEIVIFAGQRVTTKTHSHHALELIIPFDSNATLETDEGIFEASGILLKHNIRHATKADGFIIFICISPESILGKRLNYVLEERNTHRINQDSLKYVRNYISTLIINDHSETEIMSYLTNVLIPDIAKIEKQNTTDLRISNVINHILSNLHKPFDFKELREIACLSESRLIHLFKKEIGIPMRKYVLWRRLQQAIKYFLKGHTLTQSAHLAGFADVAHLTRTFVSAFGMSPSQALRNFNQTYKPLI